MRLRGGEGRNGVKLKVGPVKRANRIAVKVEEYREEKGDDSWPFSQFMTDILRASFIVGSAEEMVVVWEGLVASPDFEVVRLKNKIGQLNKPFNMHVNVLFKPVNCEDPILCEVQFCLQEVFDLMHRDHLLYEVVRARSGGRCRSRRVCRVCAPRFNIAGFRWYCRYQRQFGDDEGIGDSAVEVCHTSTTAIWHI